MRTALKACRLTVAVPGRNLIEDAEFTIRPGELAAIVGPSGSGKTTLLNCLSGIRLPDAGRVIVDGTDITQLSASRRAAFRLNRIGVVFQFAELLPELTVLENVALPARLGGAATRAANHAAQEWLERLGVGDFAGSHAEELSGGEQQRVGLARAFARRPTLVVADEPTGMLDDVTTREVVETLVEVAGHTSAAVVVATHDRTVASRMQQTYALANRRLKPSVRTGSL